MGILPRFIRLRDAPKYLGMDRNRFNVEVRPFVTTIPVGKQGIAFDRHQLDAWADKYIQCNGRPPKQSNPSHLSVDNISNKSKLDLEFEKALKLCKSKR